MTDAYPSVAVIGAEATIAPVRPPDVSVVMGVYNAGETLRTTVESVLSQHGVVFELVVVDDGSTDQTPELLAEYEHADPRVRIFRQPNLGLTQALIAGCAVSRSALIARQDAGDVSLPGRLKAQADFLELHETVAMVVTGVRERLRDGQTVSTILPQSTQSNAPQLGQSRVLVPAHGCVMFRRSAYEAAGGYREAFYYAQDCDLWQRIGEVGALAGIDDVLYESSAEVGGISTSRTSLQMQFARIAEAAARARAENGGDKQEMARAERLRERALRERSRAPSAYAIAGAHFRLGSQIEASDGHAAQQFYRQALRICPYYWRAWRQVLRRCFVSARALG